MQNGDFNGGCVRLRALGAVSTMALGVMLAAPLAQAQETTLGTVKVQSQAIDPNPNAEPGVPCLKPPLGEMVAVDLRTSKILWKRPLGTTKHSGPFGLDSPLALPTGIFTVGGPISTAGGVVFMAGGLDRAFRALDAASGDELWSAPLPAPGAATPTTYMGRDGRQYVVIAAGGHWAMGKAASDQLIAYALPSQSKPD